MPSKPARPVIGIPTQTLQVMDGIPEGLPPSWVMNQRYYLVAARAGAVPWMIPLLERDPDTLREIYDRLDGVLLAGGVDVDPGAYGMARSPHCGVTDPARDAVELRLARWALDEGKPLLGICRGLQVVNVAQGGTLLQDITAERPESIRHDYFPPEGHRRDYLAHEVALAKGSHLHRVFEADGIRVNSMHHQGIRRLGDGLAVSAVAPDGLIEGIEAANGAYCVCVQWHPEALEANDLRVHRLFDDFVTAARET
jgi:putative glutamine amidotransferase